MAAVLVRGHEVTVVEVVFATHPEQPLYDLYADGEDLTVDGSVDHFPDEADLDELIDRAERNGVIAGTYNVEYQIRTLITGDLVHRATVTVSAANVGAAGRAAHTRVDTTDRFYDARVDPLFEIIAVERVIEPTEPPRWLTHDSIAPPPG